MYIISKHKDYYDSALGVTGVDKSIVYVRKSIEFEENQIHKEAYAPLVNRENVWGRNNYFFHIKSDSEYVDVDYFLIGFCGKYYLGFRFYKFVDEYIDKKLTYDVIYDFAQIKNHIDLNPSKYSFWTRPKENNLNELFKRVSEYNDDSLFRKYNTPYFIYHPQMRLYDNERREKKYLTINGKLKDFEFAKVFDPYTAFQEVQMYISGVLGLNEKETIKISHKDRIASHGFDKWSFRKPPEIDK